MIDPVTGCRILWPAIADPRRRGTVIAGNWQRYGLAVDLRFRRNSGWTIRAGWISSPKDRVQTRSPGDRRRVWEACRAIRQTPADRRFRPAVFPAAPALPGSPADWRRFVQAAFEPAELLDFDTLLGHLQWLWPFSSFLCCTALSENKGHSGNSITLHLDASFLAYVQDNFLRLCAT